MAVRTGKLKKDMEMPLSEDQERLFEQNMGYVYALSSKMYYPGLSRDDIYSLGLGSLHKAIFTYVEGRSKLTTYIKNVFDRDFRVYLTRLRARKHMPREQMHSLDHQELEDGCSLADTLSDRLPNMDEVMVYREVIDRVRLHARSRLFNEVYRAVSGHGGYRSMFRVENGRILVKSPNSTEVWKRIAARCGYRSHRVAYTLFDRNIRPIICRYMSDING